MLTAHLDRRKLAACTIRPRVFSPCCSHRARPGATTRPHQVWLVAETSKTYVERQFRLRACGQDEADIGIIIAGDAPQRTADAAIKQKTRCESVQSEVNARLQPVASRSFCSRARSPWCRRARSLHMTQSRLVLSGLSNMDPNFTTTLDKASRQRSTRRQS